MPKDFALAGGHAIGSSPANPGPASSWATSTRSAARPVFYRLRDLGPGATIEFARSDGSIAKFTVVVKEQHDKDDSPPCALYGPTDSPELRVITCGGTFDRTIGHYNDNVIVFAELSEIA